MNLPIEFTGCHMRRQTSHLRPKAGSFNGQKFDSGGSCFIFRSPIGPTMFRSIIPEATPEQTYPMQWRNTIRLNLNFLYSVHSLLY